MPRKLSPFEINPWLEKKSYTQEKAKELLKQEKREEVLEFEKDEKLEKEFNCQVETLINKGYPEIAGLSKDEFIEQHINPLKKKLPEIARLKKEIKEGHIPFVIVVKNDLVPLEKKIPLIEVDGKKGVSDINPNEIKTAEGVKIPKEPTYLIIDVETGLETKGISPQDALAKFQKQGRLGLTAEEGVALITQHPEILKDHYIDLPGSRYESSEVPYLYLSDGEPKLEWFSAGTASDEWGAGSCGSRV